MRTIEDIFNEMLAAKDADSRLADLNSTSGTAIYRLVFYVVATVIYLTESLFEQLRVELVKVRDSAVPGTPDWYRNKALEWQDGHVIQLSQGVLSYPTIDPSAQLVKRAAVTEQPDGSILIKVATATAPLSAAQIASVTAYFRELHFAGTIYGVLSLNADKLRVTANVYFDPQVGAVNTLANIEAAIQTHLESLDFNAAIFTSKITDAIQSANGVEDIHDLEAQSDNGTGMIVISRTVVPLSGWFEVDTVLPLSTTLNLIANV